MSVKLIHPDARSLVEKSASLGLTIESGEQVNSWLDEAPYWALSPFYKGQFHFIHYKWKDDELFWKLSLSDPRGIRIPYDDTKALFGRKVAGIIIVYKNAFYAVNGPYEMEEAKLILLDTLRKKKKKAEYLVARKDAPEDEAGYERQVIMEEVRHEVWRRDRGRCTKCESVHNLEFDHIIPVSRGGANTARNIQLLCESCNRQKSNNIG